MHQSEWNKYLILLLRHYVVPGRVAALGVNTRVIVTI